MTESDQSFVSQAQKIKTTQERTERLYDALTDPTYPANYSADLPPGFDVIHADSLEKKVSAMLRALKAASQIESETKPMLDFRSRQVNTVLAAQARLDQIRAKTTRTAFDDTMERLLEAEKSSAMSLLASATTITNPSNKQAVATSTAQISQVEESQLVISMAEPAPVIEPGPTRNWLTEDKGVFFSELNDRLKPHLIGFLQSGAFEDGLVAASKFFQHSPGRDEVKKFTSYFFVAF